MKKIKSLVIAGSCLLLLWAIFSGNLFAKTEIEKPAAISNGMGNPEDNINVASYSYTGVNSIGYSTIKYNASAKKTTPMPPSPNSRNSL